ncbi:hypothetical protein FHX09_004647 [Rhizobium sp. BK538]|uniref:hypothetical protein n=1 Tax=Rhizobium sp. BK068 TaxID=2512130 RepID=UPI001854D942|nr:hypothetical protein [Rhizobium sp. BK068]MBB4170766.1 hypothetical protein [Rhizobium sp. BK538]
MTAIGSLRGSRADRIRDLLLIAYENTANEGKTRELLRLSIAEGTRFPEMVDCLHEQFIAPTLAALTGLVEQGIARVYTGCGGRHAGRARDFDFSRCRLASGV